SERSAKKPSLDLFWFFFGAAGAFIILKEYGVFAWLRIGTQPPKNTKAAAPPKKNNQASRRRRLKEKNEVMR
ncbi:MAG: hypothetical protein LBH61_00730, partial [Dysgonamonadaceae bacterium]|nr:hypothetical protein [Dysgonamonadaceae bacterium]